MGKPKYVWKIMRARRDNTAYRFELYNVKTYVIVEITIPREYLAECVASALWTAFQTGYKMSECEVFALCKMTKGNKRSS